MMTLIEECRKLGNEELIAKTKHLAQDERASQAAVIAHIGEVDRRRLYAAEGYSSLYQYCITVLRYSEGGAYRRIYTARAARRFPEILHLLESGELIMEGIVLLFPHLTEENHHKLLAAARFRTRREVEAMVARISPESVHKDSIRHCGPAHWPAQPNPTPQGQSNSEGSSQPIDAASTNTLFPSGNIAPKTPELVRFSFTGDDGLLALFNRAKQLLRHKFPSGKIRDILKELLEFFLSAKDPDRRLQYKILQDPPSDPGPATRRIPQWVKDRVWKRDRGSCVFVSPQGVRFGERGGLEYDHVTPWALGGRSDDPENIRLLCRTHNQMYARRHFGNAASGRGKGPG